MLDFEFYIFHCSCTLVYTRVSALSISSDSRPIAEKATHTLQFCESLA